MEVFAGDANGAGSETLSTYTALGADVSTPLTLDNFLFTSILLSILTSIFGLTLEINPE